MTDPADPVLHFDVFVVHEPAVANELFESVDEFFESYDGRGRPVRVYGEPGRVALALATTEPQGAELRARVEHYYFVFAARHPTQPGLSFGVQLRLKTGRATSVSGKMTSV
ncbi:hypothetical protein [Streptomyces sp. NPDC004721]